MPDSLPTDEELDAARQELEEKRAYLAELRAAETEAIYGTQRLDEKKAIEGEHKRLDDMIAEMEERVKNTVAQAAPASPKNGNGGNKSAPPAPPPDQNNGGATNEQKGS